MTERTLPGTPLSDEAVQQGKALTLEWPTSLRYARCRGSPRWGWPRPGAT